MQRKANVSRQRVRTIPEKLFYSLWVIAETEEDKSEYVRNVMHPNSKYHLCYRKLDIELEYFEDMLRNIWDMCHMPVKDIVVLAGMKPSTVARVMCYSIDSFNNWYYGRTECPGYIKLSLLRYFGLFKLGHYIYIDCEEPVQYIPKKKSRVVDEEKEDDLPLIPKYQYETMRKRDSMKEWEQEHVHHGNSEVQDLLERLRSSDLFKK